MTDLIIGAAHDLTWPQLQPWALSLVETGFPGKKVLLHDGTLTGTACQGLIELGFELHVMPQVSPNFFLSQRFFEIWQFLKQARETFRWVVVTDVRDLIFQSDPAAWCRMHYPRYSLLAASEGIAHKHEPWSFQRAKEGWGTTGQWLLSDRVLLNDGLFAGTQQEVAELALQIFLLASPLAERFWGIDQTAFNLLLHYSPWPDGFEMPPLSFGFALHCCVLAQPSRKAEYEPHWIEEEPWFDKATGCFLPAHSQTPFAVVHAWDRTAYKQQIMEKYQGTRAVA
jgi:hypothetical protein